MDRRKFLSALGIVPVVAIPDLLPRNERLEHKEKEDPGIRIEGSHVMITDTVIYGPVVINGDYTSVSNCKILTNVGTPFIFNGRYNQVVGNYIDCTRPFGVRLNGLDYGGRAT